MNEKFELDFFEGDYYILLGYLVMVMEKIFEKGVEIELDGYCFVLELVSNIKIEIVRVICFLFMF